MVRSLKSRFSYYLGDIIYGANDGIITTFAVVSSASGAGFSATVIIVLGIANLVADGFSMGASRYLSIKSDQSLQHGAIERNRSAVADGSITFVAFAIAGFLPLIPFLVPESATRAFEVSAVATAVSLFLVGASRSFVTTKGFFVSGFEMLTVGGIAALMAYALGAGAHALIGVPSLLL
jgi:VIT1/CCC1 family predicted Fe2+/Mn2+ transporter